MVIDGIVANSLRGSARCSPLWRRAFRSNCRRRRAFADLADDLGGQRFNLLVGHRALARLNGDGDRDRLLARRIARARSRCRPASDRARPLRRIPWRSHRRAPSPCIRPSSIAPASKSGRSSRLSAASHSSASGAKAALGSVPVRSTRPSSGSRTSSAASMAAQTASLPAASKAEV
jgi:hypothetical protein